MASAPPALEDGNPRYRFVEHILALFVVGGAAFYRLGFLGFCAIAPGVILLLVVTVRFETARSTT